ncbi:MAG: NAD(+)/NADH kinase [Actinomycetota bacterium]|nr:NAD(+)/NADH kinase [Actinomycetota bacterium]
MTSSHDTSSPASSAPAPSASPAVAPSAGGDAAHADLRRVAVVVNPAKKAGIDLRATLTDLCREAGWAEPLWLETTVQDPGAGQARQALEEGADLVIVAGGDGTVRAVAGVLAGTDTALGLIPLGTGNLLARNLGLEINDPALAARQALTGADRRIDMIRAVVDNDGEGQLFLVMAGLGFDAAIMADANDQLKDRLGWLAYVDAGIRNLPGRPVRAMIRIDGRRTAVRHIRGVSAGNCGRLQGGFEMFPDAKVDDGLMDVMTMAPSGRLGWLGVVGSLIERQRGSGKGAAVEYFKGRSVEISVARPQEIQLDGDHLGQGTHLAMSVEAGALTVRVPAADGSGASGSKGR